MLLLGFISEIWEVVNGSEVKSRWKWSWVNWCWRGWLRWRVLPISNWSDWVEKSTVYSRHNRIRNEATEIMAIILFWRYQNFCWEQNSRLQTVFRSNRLLWLIPLMTNSMCLQIVNADGAVAHISAPSASLYYHSHSDCDRPSKHSSTACHSLKSRPKGFHLLM